MPFTSRVFRTLESELNRRLAFTYKIVRLLDASGSPATFLTAALRNDSSITLNNIRGTISPASGALFKRATFCLPTLGPHQEIQIARIQARVPATFASVSVATVDVSSEADLSAFRFTERGRFLTYVAAPVAAEPSTATRGGKNRPMRSADHPRTSIPLSPLRDAS